VKCECGSIAVVATASDYVCAHCGLCLEPVLSGNNGCGLPEGTEAYHGPRRNWGRLDGRQDPAAHAYGLLRRSCEELGLSLRFALEAITLYRQQRRRLKQTHPPFLAPLCLFHVIRSHDVPVTRHQLVATFHNPKMTARSLFHALTSYDLPEVRR
jgi:hypothetical protein